MTARERKAIAKGMRESGIDKMTPAELVVFGAHYGDYISRHEPTTGNGTDEGAISAGLWGVRCFRMALAQVDWSEANPDAMSIGRKAVRP